MTKKYLSLVATVFVIAAFVSSADAQRRTKRTKKKQPAAAAKTTEKTLPSNAIRTVSGLTYLVTKAGTGPMPKVGDTVSVHYTGLLTDGTKFDSSRDRGQPITFPLGKGRVIKGWDEGIAKLHVGGQAILVIPPSIGYGSRGAGGVIPPDATLIFVVELVEIKAP